MVGAEVAVMLVETVRLVDRKMAGIPHFSLSGLVKELVAALGSYS